MTENNIGRKGRGDFYVSSTLKTRGGGGIENILKVRSGREEQKNKQAADDDKLPEIVEGKNTLHLSHFCSKIAGSTQVTVRTAGITLSGEHGGQLAPNQTCWIGFGVDRPVSRPFEHPFPRGFHCLLGFER